MRTLPLTLIFILLLTGCAPASDSPGPVTSTPNIMPRLNPSPTPSGSMLPLTCQVTDLHVYVNEANGYCFAYPMRFSEGIQPMLNGAAIMGPSIGDSVDPVFASFVVQIKPATGESLRAQTDAFLKELSAADPAAFT